MIENTISFRVRFSESSTEGIAHHSSYIAWLEMARLQLLREHGLSYKELNKLGIHMTVIDLQIQFFKPIFFDDIIYIHTSIAEVPTMKVLTNYTLMRDDAKMASAKTVQTFISGAGKPARPPKVFAELVARYFDVNFEKVEVLG